MLLLSSSLGATFDPSYAGAEQRAVQNAANAAAITGARALANWTETNSAVTAMPDVLGTVDSAIWWSKPDVSCSYIDDAGTKITTCDAEVPADATGVRVDVSETHVTFLSWLRHDPKYVTTQASATAHIQMIVPDGSTSPFILCGIDTMLASGGTLSVIISQSGQWVINDAAYGQTFLIHDARVASCGFPSLIFKGLADQDANAGKPIDDWFDIFTGTKGSPILDTIDAPGGCPSGATDPYNCIMFIPIATDNPVPNNNQLSVVQFAPFMMTGCDANCDQGTLIARLLMNTPDNPPAWVIGTWARGDNGVFIGRLKE